MKKLTLALMALLPLSMTGQTTLVKGKLVGYTPADTLVYFVQSDNRNGYQNIEVNKNGTFTINDNIDQPTTLSIIKTSNGDRDGVVILYADPKNPLDVVIKPGKDILGDECLTAEFKGKNANRSTFENISWYNYTGSQIFSDKGFSTLADFNALQKYIEQRYAPMKKALKGIKDDKAYVEKEMEVLDNQTKRINYAYAIYQEQHGHHMTGDKGFMDMLGAIDLNDTTNLQDAVGYIDWKYASNPTVYSPLDEDATKLRLARELFSNQDQRNKIADQLIYGKLFLASWGYDLASEEMAPFYDEYEKTSTDTTYTRLIAEQRAKMELNKPGQEALSFSLNDENDESYDFRDIVGGGKVTYIDFWATWCGPCKRENPFLAKLYEEYKDNPGIRIVSISIDTNVKAWKEMIGNEKPGWEQYNIPDPENSAGLSGYNINSIPRFMLFDKNGNLVKSSAPRPSAPEVKDVINALL